MDIDLKKKNKLDLKPFIKVIKVFSILGVFIAIAFRFTLVCFRIFA